MACSNLTAGFTLDCNDSNGGIEKIFIANGPVDAITESAGVVTAITVGGSPLAPVDFFEFEVPRQTSSITETHTVSQENGTLFYSADGVKKEPFDGAGLESLTEKKKNLLASPIGGGGVGSPTDSHITNENNDYGISDDMFH